MKIAIIGTRGLPAQYGGFETLVEFLTKYLSDKLDITVFCSKENNTKLKEYNNSKIISLSLNANGWQSILYDSLSVLRSYKNFDRILILGPSNIAMSFLGKYRNKFIFNIGGIEWQRRKWGFVASRIIKHSERITVKNSDYIIADNEGIQNYLKKTYNRDSYLIEYGGDQVKRIEAKNEYLKKYPFLETEYILAVARVQPDNNLEMILESFIHIQKYKLIIVGNWNVCKYGKNLKNKYLKINNIILFDAIYNQDELNVIRTNAKIYLHGHSAGGTNPGLVEAMNIGLPIFCFDNTFNRFTTEEKAEYFNNSEELQDLLINTKEEKLDQIRINMKEIADRRYKWEIIAKKYFDVITL